MTAAFLAALEFVLAREGGYSNDSKDPGGETSFGISKRAYPQVDIKALTKEQATQIYLSDYWTPCRCGELPEEMAIMVFDCAVNQGVGFAKTALQLTLRVIADGKIGAKTLAAAHGMGADVFANRFSERRITRYLSMNNATEERYERGWCVRVVTCVVCALTFHREAI